MPITHSPPLGTGQEVFALHRGRGPSPLLSAWGLLSPACNEHTNLAQLVSVVSANGLRGERARGFRAGVTWSRYVTRGNRREAALSNTTQASRRLLSPPPAPGPLSPSSLSLSSVRYEGKKLGGGEAKVALSGQRPPFQYI